jgi:hypothetical protein
MIPRMMSSLRSVVQLDNIEVMSILSPNRILLHQSICRGDRLVFLPITAAHEPPAPKPSRHNETTRNAFRSIVWRDSTIVWRISNINIPKDNRTIAAPVLIVRSVVRVDSPSDIPFVWFIGHQ